MAKFKKKSSVVEFIKKHRKSKKSRSSSNPKSAVMGFMSGQLKDLGGQLLPVVLAYIAARVTSRLAYNVVGSRVGALSKHVSPAVNLALLFGSGWAMSKSKTLQRHKDEVAIGFAISTIQTLLSVYLPGIGRLLSEPTAAPSKMNALADDDQYGQNHSAQSLLQDAEIDTVRGPRPLISDTAGVDGEPLDSLYTGTFAQ